MGWIVSTWVASVLVPSSPACRNAAPLMLAKAENVRRSILKRLFSSGIQKMRSREMILLHAESMSSALLFLGLLTEGNVVEKGLESSK